MAKFDPQGEKLNSLMLKFSPPPFNKFPLIVDEDDDELDDDDDEL
jgi:hypothetical protein